MNNQNKILIIVLFLIEFIILYITAVHAKTQTQEETIGQFKEDQIKCLQKKSDMYRGMVKILLDEKILIQQLLLEKDSNTLIQLTHTLAKLDMRLSKLLKIRDSGRYSCSEDSDDMFLDKLLGKDVEIYENGKIK